MRFLRKIFSPKVVEHFEVVEALKRSDLFQHQIEVRKEDVMSMVRYIKSEWDNGKNKKEHISTFVLDRLDAAGIVTKIEGCDCFDYYELLQEYIKNSLEKMGYITYVRKHVKEGQNGSCRQRFIYFLKPKPSFLDKKYDQKYGNILMELKMDLKDSFHFKFQANYYSGFNYSEPKSFDDLLEILLKG